MPIIQCKICSKEFMANSSNKKYCGDCNPGKRKKYISSYWLSSKEIRRLNKIKKEKLNECIKNEPIKIKKFDKRSAFRKVRRTVEKPDCCLWCGSKGKLALHHIDKNVTNNDLSNLVYICYKCHREAHPDLPDKFFSAGIALDKGC